MLSQTSAYALRAVLHLADHAGPGGRAVPVGEIAQALDVPRNYLSKTLHQLARAGVVASTFGPGGGFRLARPAAELTLERVVAPFDAATERHCLLGRARCADADPCPAHHRWKSISEQIRHFFAATTVADLQHGAARGLLPSRAPRRRPARPR
jgi:Rrf2 family iron-sulfur cluster assembly transcriptional regulator